MKKMCISCLQVVGDETRLNIYYLLSKNKEMTVSEVVSNFDIKQPTVSHHIKKLTQAGLLNYRKQGKKVYYSANKQCIHSNKTCILQK